MYAIVDLSVGERIFEFASQHLYGGRRVDVLLNKLGLTYRKGKTEADLQKARQLSYKRISWKALLQGVACFFKEWILFSQNLSRYARHI